MTTPAWWRNAICYQIYPRSFADSNDDGIGDLKGILDKLDYLKWLGVTALWISPFYPSAQLDWGYDISDYTGVHPDYGTLADVEELIKQAHQRGIRILLDMVLNHTSDQHDWFQQSKSSKDNPYRDWYVWHDGKNGAPPNDWESIFGGSAWKFDKTTGQYYYHFFFEEQPDLNWRNPLVKEALFGIMRFWLDRGVDGFRLDAIGSLFEDATLTNAKVDGSLEEMFIRMRTGAFENWDILQQKLRFQMNLPEIHDLLRDIRALVDRYTDRILLGESSDVELCGSGNDQLHSVFNFDIIDNLNAEYIRNRLSNRLRRLPSGAWDCNTLSNHDRRRSYTVYQDGQHNDARARVALAMTTFLQGTPVFYYGEEIGMTNLEITTLEALRDAFGVRYYHILRDRYNVNHDEAFNIAASYMGRDGCRTPMQWYNQPNAGFSSEGVETWLPVHPNYVEGVNVADQEAKPDSMLMFFRRIVQVRQQNEALRVGDFQWVENTENALVFWRRTASQHCLVALNLSAETIKVELGKTSLDTLYANHPILQDVSNKIELTPYAVFVGKISNLDHN